jgi:hypothetical protein
MGKEKLLRTIETRSALRVGAALALVLVLTGALAWRVLARHGAPAPSARPEALAVPHWGGPGAEDWPVAFRTNLDLLAPLGTGTENAAVLMKDFAKPNGSRAAEADAAMKRRVEGPPDVGKILPPRDPFLLEAEKWADQATMRFYPDVFPVDGFATHLPNLLVAITIGRSWVARGMASPDPGAALADYRRAIRLGRLLRQEDATTINDLVGLACIWMGAQAVYEHATRTGDQALALTTAIVIGEHAPQRLRTAQLLTRVSIVSYVHVSAGGAMSLDLPEERLEDMLKVAETRPERRFRSEALLQLGVVRFFGTDAQKEKARAFLDHVAAAGDPVLSRLAAWSRDTRPTKEELDAISFPIAKN